MARRISRLIIGVAVAALGAGCAATSTSPKPAASPVVTPKAAAASAPDPAAAAVTYVASTDTLMGHSPVGRREILRRLVAPGTLDEQAAALDQATSAIADKLGLPAERLVWVEAPLTVTVQRSDATSASVDVWSVSVLGAPDAGSPQQVWRTVHVDLVLVDGAWLVQSATADPGPTPSANEQVLPSGWAAFAQVASWKAAVPGVDL